MDNSYMLAIKGICNTNCTFCNFYETKGNINEKKHFKELKKEIEGVSDRGIKTIKIGINGYEPTVFGYFFEVLDFIKSKGFNIYLFTNGVRLADKKFTKKLSKFVNKVVITLYSSNDEEHNILTQNKDSYKIKHNAISNCLKFEIKVQLTILLLRPTLSSLSIIFSQISIYFENKYFLRQIQLIVPNAVMGEERNNILIPPYTSIIKEIRHVLEQHLDTFIRYNIKLQPNDIIPKCLFKFSNYNRISLLVKKQEKGTNKNIHTSYDIKRIFFTKCNDCVFLDECNGVEPEYINIYGSREFTKGDFLVNEYTLEGIKKSLSSTLNKFDNHGVWFDFIYLDKLVNEYEKLFNFPKIVCDYYIKDVLIMKSKLKKIRFRNDILNDTFILKINQNIDGLYNFSLDKRGNNNVKIYNLITVLLYKKLNKGV
ncbi:MAG: radical SAM protein [Candidatus Gracilibacteria bacterium]